MEFKNPDFDEVLNELGNKIRENPKFSHMTDKQIADYIRDNGHILFQDGRQELTFSQFMLHQIKGQIEDISFARWCAKYNYLYPPKNQHFSLFYERARNDLTAVQKSKFASIAEQPCDKCHPFDHSVVETEGVKSLYYCPQTHTKWFFTEEDDLSNLITLIVAAVDHLTLDKGKKAEDLLADEDFIQDLMELEELLKRDPTRELPESLAKLYHLYQENKKC